ncbi:zinc carboxypeptidase [Microbacterium sp. AG1240]|uniref:M14 family zinc carboxypeptidase n=1 Tax=Microbacterium sp. AG1240 TaxID=2183992 RepID=UPI000F1B1CD5|nr:M14 family zinc carboxypeptidase [Microbacterium sp. AG1240]RKT36006.1 zinc carboxypeptidase [Microbacterium sp. AG1240]
MRTRALVSIGGVVAIASSMLAFAPATAAVDPPALSIVRPTSSIEMPTQYPSQPRLTVVPDLPTDASIARGVMPYDEIAPFLNRLMDRSNRVSSQVVGTSYQGREIYMVTVTSRETPAETAQQDAWRTKVKYDPAAAASDAALAEGYKVPLWFNANIHGNEWEGTDATLNYIEDLATSADPVVQDLLDNHRIYFTVTNNPDGRALGQRGTANGYDPNRDFITGATKEASIVRDLASIIQPTYFIDLHGYTSVLQVEPCGPPHGENYEYDLFVPHAYATALDIEKAVTEANIPGNTYYDPEAGDVTSTNTGFINIPYRDQRSGWDDWPPIFAPQYVAYQGAVTNTVELPLGRSGDQPARAKVNIEVAEVVIDTVADYVQDNSASLLENQIEIFARGLTGTESVEIPADVSPDDLAEGVPTEWTDIWDENDIYTTEFPRAYVIPLGAGQRSDSDAQTLVQQLLVNGIEVSRTTAPFTAEGVTYPAGSYYVDMHQPVRGLANALLADGTDITDRVPDMYDISAWSLSLLWGADVEALGYTTDPAPTTALEPISEAPLTGSVAPASDYLSFEPRGVADYQAINELLGEGIALSQLEDGTVVFRRDAAADAAARAVADIYGVDVAASDGSELREEGVAGLRPLRVGYASNTDDRDALTKLGFTDLVPVTAATIESGAVDLASIDVLWIGSAVTIDPATQATAFGAMRAYVESGKPVVGRGTAGASFVSTFGLAALTATSGTNRSNGIVSIDVPEAGVLGDYAQDTAFVSPATWFTGLGAGVTVEASYAATDPLVSGHWAASDGRSSVDAAGQAAAVSATSSLAGNRLFLFGTSPTYRNHPVGAFSDIARSIFWATETASSIEPPVVQPEPTATPTPEPTTVPTPEPTTEPTPEPTTTGAPALVVPPSDSSLATTGGSSPGSLWAGAAALMMFGAGAFVLARTRARRSAE